MKVFFCYESSVLHFFISFLSDKIRLVLFTAVLWSFIEFCAAFVIHCTEQVIAVWRSSVLGLFTLHYLPDPPLLIPFSCPCLSLPLHKILSRTGWDIGARVFSPHKITACLRCVLTKGRGGARMSYTSQISGTLQQERGVNMEMHVPTSTQTHTQQPAWIASRRLWRQGCRREEGEKKHFASFDLGAVPLLGGCSHVSEVPEKPRAPEWQTDGVEEGSE